jgi:hypothetical protein
MGWVMIRWTLVDAMAAAAAATAAGTSPPRRVWKLLKARSAGGEGEP